MPDYKASPKRFPVRMCSYVTRPPVSDIWRPRQKVVGPPPQTQDEVLGIFYR
ncbi:hypothetical protein BNJ_00347 [Kaumoebavirus]|uniref:hypothetical protein n=1 Tax=Kaumoebavirus TaxID=1859492 RepID=UPI0009C1ABE3|nr:hypothetical protein BNJ_00347 [Kaumoebavirus]ARA72167.1 hypothetical protein BNJ_00347 [Kaumoebavirus]